MGAGLCKRFLVSHLANEDFKLPTHGPTPSFVCLPRQVPRKQGFCPFSPALGLPGLKSTVPRDEEGLEKVPNRRPGPATSAT